MIRNYLRRAYRAVLPLLYARSKFKLFLKIGLEDVELRTLALASTTDYFSNFVAPIPVRSPFGRSMLIVAPHQDDETIGCGGALALQVRSGYAAGIILLQDGAEGCEELGLSPEAMTAMRNEESRQAAAVLGLASPVFFNFSGLADNFSEASRRLRDIMDERRTDALFVPWPLDGHGDHRVACYIAADALRNISRDVRVFCYEVWGLCVPNVMVVIDDVMEQKLEMLSCFKFANSAIDYVQATKGLNMFHSRALGAGVCRYAERFFELPRREYIEFAENLRTKERRSGAPEPAGGIVDGPKK